MKCYKGFNKDMTCRGFQYKEGDTVELKKCPFCGHEAAMQTVTTAMEKEPRYRVICPMCRIATDWDFWKPEDVAAHWNRRTHETD